MDARAWTRAGALAVGIVAAGIGALAVAVAPGWDGRVLGLVVAAGAALAIAGRRWRVRLSGLAASGLGIAVLAIAAF